MTIPGLRQANLIMADLKRLGIQDVELMFDKQTLLWAAVQVFKPSGRILLLGDPRTYETEPTIMFWIRNNDMTYRDPSEQDLSDIIAIVKRAQVWFEQGSDKMIDEMEKQEKATYDQNRKAQSDKIRSVSKPLKRAIRKELG